MPKSRKTRRGRSVAFAPMIQTRAKAIDDEEGEPTAYEVLLGSLPVRNPPQTEHASAVNSATSPQQAECDEETASNDEEEDSSRGVRDPLRRHFDRILKEEEVEEIDRTLTRPLKLKDLVHRELDRVQWLSPLCVSPSSVVSPPPQSGRPRPLQDLHVRSRLVEHWQAATGLPADRPFTPQQQSLFAVMNNYQNLLFTKRTFENGEELRRLYVLHALNHVLKTRSRVLRNNAQLAAATAEGKEAWEVHDQGLVRPKVLILVPFRESALRTVNAMIQLLVPSGKGQVAYHKRFLEHFQHRDDDHDDESEKVASSHSQKPESFQKLFAGNIDDCFRLGISVKKASLRLYTQFYASDVILASPLGLRTVIGAEGDKKRDFDFLSSLEMVVVDQADVFLMQNWDHVAHIFSHMHLQPKDPHGVDFSRVREWALDNRGRYYCQTLIFAAFLTPEIGALTRNTSHNYAGLVRVVDTSSEGTICRVVSALPQTFHRVACDSYVDLPAARFDYFVEKVLPRLRTTLMEWTCIFVPSYFDFVRLRNYTKREGVTCVRMSEYSSASDIARARSAFFHGRTTLLFYTERLHFFRRLRLRGIRHLVFYSPPTYAEFYSELVNTIGGDDSAVGGTCTLLFSKFDALAVSRIVGSGRCAQLLAAADSIFTLTTGQS